ncbi:MAG: 5-oxoprolinase subunit PxpA [Flammeovirgaceae bacterium]
MTVDLNCDMGEGMPNDASIMPFISSANIACGYHAGDAQTIKDTIALCLRHQVAIGAHPGFDDKPNFGRTNMKLTSKELYDLITLQLFIIDSACRKQSAVMHHVKPHGALYNMAAKDEAMSRTIAQAVFDFNPKLIYYGLSGSHMISQANLVGIKTASEVFADRTYQPDGSLTPRTEKNALIESEEESLSQVMKMVKESKVVDVTGKPISIKADTICLHGDGEHAAAFASAIYHRLKSEGIKIKAL